MIGLVMHAALAATPAIGAGYYGHYATHPGGYITLEQPLGETGPHAVWFGGRLAAYTHPGNHVGIQLRPELGYRIAAEAGPFLEASAGPAYVHRFVAGALYRSTPGGVRRTLDPGRPGFAPGAGVGLGWSLSPEQPLRITARGEGWLVMPTNRGWRAGAAVSLGITVLP